MVTGVTHPTPQNQQEVVVDQVRSTDHSSHTSGTLPRKRLEMDIGVLEYSGHKEDKTQSTDDSVLQKSRCKEDNILTASRVVVEKSGYNEDTISPTDKSVRTDAGTHPGKNHNQTRIVS